MRHLANFSHTYTLCPLLADTNFNILDNRILFWQDSIVGKFTSILFYPATDILFIR